MTEDIDPTTSRLRVDDTELFVRDSRGTGSPVVYLNGAYADHRHWNRVIAALGAKDWRHIAFDERARGRSGRSADYSFESCLRDLDAVLAATGVRRPLLVGWSYGATIAMHWADRNPGRIRGVLAVDGAMPYDWIDDEARERLRMLFHRMRWMLPIASRLGLAARMSAEAHAEVNIEANELLGSLGPVLERLECPVHYVVASGGHLGTDDEEMARVRATLDPVLERKLNFAVSATVSSNHSRVLRREYRTVSDSIRELAKSADVEPDK